MYSYIYSYLYIIILIDHYDLCLTNDPPAQANFSTPSLLEAFGSRSLRGRPGGWAENPWISMAFSGNLSGIYMIYI